MSKSEAQIRANKKHRQTTAKQKFVQIRLLRSIHHELKSIAEQTGDNMQDIIAKALDFYNKGGSYDI